MFCRERFDTPSVGRKRNDNKAPAVSKKRKKNIDFIREITEPHMRGKYNMMCCSYVKSYERFSPFYGDGDRIYIILLCQY